MKNIKIIFFVIVGLVLTILGFQHSMMRKKAARAKAEASRAKHEVKKEYLVSSTKVIAEKIEKAYKAKGVNMQDIMLLENKHHDNVKRIKKIEEKIKDSEDTIININSALFFARDRLAEREKNQRGRGE